jgi:ParB family chromosome partitioning protein
MRRNAMFGLSPRMPHMVEVAITAVRENPYQPRKMLSEESIDAMVESIREHGLLFAPVVLKTDDPDVYILAAGQRRLKALEKLGWETIPITVAEKGNALEIALIENLQREDPHPLDMAEAVAQLAAEFDYTHQKIAAIIGERRTTVTEWLTIAKLTDAIKQECRALDTITKMHLVALARLSDDPEQQHAALEQIRAGASTRELRSRRGGRPTTPRPADIPKALLPVIRVIETTHKVRDALATIQPSAAITNHPERLTELRELLKEIGSIIKKLERGEPKQKVAERRSRRRRASMEATAADGEISESE